MPFEITVETGMNGKIKCANWDNVGKEIRYAVWSQIKKKCVFPVSVLKYFKLRKSLPLFFRQFSINTVKIRISLPKTQCKKM